MRKKLLVALLACLQGTAWGQAAYEYRYWFDGDESTQQSGTSLEKTLKLDADVSALGCSMHTLHIQVKDSNGVWGSPQTRFFTRVPGKTMKCYYWFNDDIADMQAIEPKSGQQAIDVNHLPDGCHMIHVYAKDGITTSPIYSNLFLKLPTISKATHCICICYIDGKQFRQKRLTAKENIVNWNIDVNGLAPGFHTIRIQLFTESGTPTNIYNTVFLKTTTVADMADMNCAYRIDGGEMRYKSGQYGRKLLRFDLDVDSLEEGLHKIEYMLSGKHGTMGKLRTAFFIKTKSGGEGIVCYRYWVNDNEDRAVQVDLPKAQSRFSLSEMLPVESQPIRTSNFHFEAESNGTPMVYAKNELNIRFYDANGRCTQAKSEYIDYSSGEAASILATLVSGKQEITETPAKNEIRWFKFIAEKGDSVNFKTSIASTIDVLDSVGSNIYRAQHERSTEAGGICLPESGTFYVALHNVADTTAMQVALVYNNVTQNIITGIDGITGKQPSSDFFDLQGRKVKNPTKGVYIMDEKKVMVK